MKQKLPDLWEECVLGLFMVLCGSCTYYQPVLKSNAEILGESIFTLEERAVIVHSKQGVFYLDSMKLDRSLQQITGSLDKVPENHVTYLNATNLKYRYKREQKDVLKEVHLFTPLDSGDTKGSRVVIAADQIDQIQFIEKDKGKNILSVVGVVLGIVMVTALVLAIAYPPLPV
jgi:hypothetical protein